MYINFTRKHNKEPVIIKKIHYYFQANKILIIFAHC